MNPARVAWDTETTFLLALMSLRGVGPKTLGRVMADLRALGLRTADILSLPAAELSARYGLSRLPSKADLDQARRDLAEMMSRGVSILRLDQPSPISLDEDDYGELTYPPQLASTLGSDAPPVLFAGGEMSLLARAGVGFCGSREASERALGAVTETASQVASAGINVISGYARGVDLAAHRAALKSGGVTTMVLAEGVLRFSPRTELRELVSPYNTLILSEFPPRMSWSVGSAMKRNSTICAFADAMVVVESKLSGGTFAAGNSALELGRPLFVVDYGEGSSMAPGNRYFIERGAVRLRRSRSSGQPMSAGLVEAATRQAAKDDIGRVGWSAKDFMWRTQIEKEAETKPTPLGLWVRAD